MLAMALPPAPPTPITLIRGRSSSTSGRMKSMLMSLNLPQTLQRVEPSGRIFESLRVSSQAEKLTRTKKLGASVARKTHLSTAWAPRFNAGPRRSAPENSQRAEKFTANLTDFKPHLAQSGCDGARLGRSKENVAERGQFCLRRTAPAILARRRPAR